MKQLKSARIEIFVLLVMGLSVFIFSPTLSWPYAWDDIDLLSRASLVDNFQSFFHYAGSSHNEHFFPLIKMMYVLCYYFFGLKPWFFHLLIIGAYLIAGILLMKMVLRFTASGAAAIGTMVLFVWSASCPQCLEVAFSHSLLGLPVILFTLYGVWMYGETDSWRWSAASAAGAFLAPVMFASGVLAGVWVALFYLLCLPKEYKTERGKKWRLLLPVFAGWLGGLWMYFLHTGSGSIINKLAARPWDIQMLHLLQTAVLTVKSLWLYAIPLVTPHEKFSLFLAFFLCGMAIIKRTEIPWRIVLFFILWAAGNYAFVYYSRAEIYGSIYPVRPDMATQMLISTPRYHLYPSLSLPVIYGIIIAVLLKDKQWADFKWKKAVGLLMAMLLVFYAGSQHGNISRGTRARPDLYTLGLEFSETVRNYLEENNKEKLSLKNSKVNFGQAAFPRRELKFYGNILLSPDLRQRIVWDSQTDRDFIVFLESQKDLDPLLKRIWQNE